MKVSGSLDLAGLEVVADRTAIPSGECFEGRVISQGGTVYVYTSGAWEPLAAGADSVPNITLSDAGKVLKTPDGVSASWEEQYPDDTGASGKFLQSDGSGGVSWQDPPATIPAQAGNGGKALTTDGSSASWTDALSRSSLAAGTPAHVIYNDDTTGEIASEAQLAPKRGGFGEDVSGFTGFVKATAGDFTAAPLAASDMPSGIDATKIGAGSVDNTKLGRLANVTSDVQTQLDAKLAKGGGTMTGAITLAADPSAALEAATKQYVDNVASALKVKNSVFVATDANITLSGEQTIGGQAVVSGDRVLVRAQSSQAQNGIYTVSTGAWTRSSDANTWNNLRSAFCFVEEGDYADTGWVCTINAGGTLETTPVTWAQFSGAGSYTAGNGLQISGTTFSAKLDGSSLAASGSGLKVSDTVNLVTPVVTQYEDFSAIATPSAPGAGVRVYAKSDGKIYKRAAGEAESILGGGLVTDLKSTAFTAAPGYHYLCDTSAGAFTVTLPSGASGSVIRFSDDRRSWANYNLTLAPQTGQMIGSLSASESLVCDITGAHVQLAWDGSRWVIDTNGYAANVNSGIALAGTDGSAGLVNPYTEGSGVVYSARYTPSLTNGSNVSGSTPISCMYTRVGKIVTVSGQVNCTTTAAANTLSLLQMSLPIASNLTSGADLSGSGSRNVASGTAGSAVLIYGSSANDRAILEFNSTSTVDSTIGFTFSYEIK